MERDELCLCGEIFAEDEKYMLSRYESTDKNLYLKAWDEIFENSAVYNDENFKQKLWDDVLSDTNKLQLKITDKLTLDYVGEVTLMKLDVEMPELGIQLLRKYHSQGIGTHVMKLFVDKLRAVMQVEAFLVRIFSDNYISQRMFETMGALRIGEEGKEYVALMYRLMQEMGREKFEETIEGDFDTTQRYIMCYKLEV